MIAGIIAQAVAGAALPTDEHWLNTHLLIDATGQANGAGYANDSCRHHHAIGYVNGAAILNEKFELDGVNDYLRFPISPLWQPGTKFTFEMFGVEVDQNTAAKTLAAWYDADASDNRSWLFSLNVGSLQLQVFPSGTSSPSTSVSFAWTPTIGQAYDLAWAWDGAAITLWIDGVCVASTAYAGAWYWAAGAPYLTIGTHFQSDAGVAARCVDGRFRAVRITRGVARMSGPVSTVYAVPSLPLPTAGEATVDPDWDKVVLLARVNAAGTKVIDASPFDWYLQAAGNAGVTTVNKPAGAVGSLTFDGTSDAFYVRKNPFLTPGAADHTIELYARHADNTADRTYFAQYTASGENRAFILNYLGASTPDIIRMSIYPAGTTAGSTAVSSDAWTPTVGTFYHIAYSRQGDTHRFFVDGAQLGADAVNAANPFTDGDVFWIGAYRSASASSIDNSMNGQIAELRVTKGLSRYNAGFAPPAAPL